MATSTRDSIRPKTSDPLSLRSSSGDDPKITAPQTSESTDPYDPDSTREPKRRRNCLRDLEKVEELLIAPQNSFPNFSFTFDTDSVASAPEITPKFGSFNFTASSSEKRESFTEEEKAEPKEESESDSEQSGNEIANGVSKATFEAQEEEEEEEEE